jgi:pyruvate dehydrogenase E2 component (dihydrolipoamide acetyltransferase)
MQFKLPDIGEGVAEGEIVQWLVNPGDTIKEDQALVEVMTDKVTAEIPSPVTGTIQQLFGEAGDVIAVGSVIADIDTDGSATDKPAANTSEPASPKPIETKQQANPQPAVATVASAPSAPTSNDKVLAAPATRKRARQLGVNLTTVAGTGPKGRITPSDVAAAANGHNNNNGAFTGAASTVSIPADRREPFKGIRRKIAEHLSLSKQKAPHFAYVEEIDVTELVSLRKQLKNDAAEQGIKLTYLPFIMLAVSRALSEFPILNSTLDDTAGELVYKGAHNLGMAVDTDNGLVVPNIPKVQGQTLLGLAQQVNQLADKARTGSLSQADVTGGTFTITSIGSIGGLFGVPIINYPEVAILGVNSIRPRPMVVDGDIAVREVLYLSLSCDHRVVDGADAARFMNTLKALLEQPARLLV